MTKPCYLPNGSSFYTTDISVGHIDIFGEYGCCQSIVIVVWPLYHFIESFELDKLLNWTEDLRNNITNHNNQTSMKNNLFCRNFLQDCMCAQQRLRSDCACAVWSESSPGTLWEAKDIKCLHDYWLNNSRTNYEEDNNYIFERTRIPRIRCVACRLSKAPTIWYEKGKKTLHFSL